MLSPGGVTGSSPRSPRVMGLYEGEDVVQRQVEWEREIETLDQKEMELHQSQVRLIREQTAIFIRDLGVLQLEVAVLKDTISSGDMVDTRHIQTQMLEQAGAIKQQEQLNASLKQRVDYLERLLGESADRHSAELESAKSAQARLAIDAKNREAHHVSVTERLGYVEKLVGDSFEKHARELQSSQMKLEQMHSRLASCEIHASGIEGVRSAQAELSNQNLTKEASHASMQERLDFVESLLGDSSDKHSQAISAAHNRLEQLHGAVQEQLGSRLEQTASALRERMDRFEKTNTEQSERHGREIEEKHSSVQQRLTYVEQQLGDSVDKHARELERQSREVEQAKSKLDQMHGRISDHYGQIQTQASLGERVSYVERHLGDSVDRHQEELGEAHAKLDQLRGRVTQCEAHSVTIEGLKKNHAVLTSEKAKKDAHTASMAERLEYLEKQWGDSADKHSREMTQATSKLEQLHTRVTSSEKATNALTDQHRSQEAIVADERAALHAHHSTLRERVDFLENRMGDSADAQTRELEAVKMAHGRLATDSKARDAHHSTVADRLSFLEKSIGDSADNHAQEFAAAQSKIEQMHSRVVTVEAQAGHVDMLRKSHASLASDKAAKDAHQLAMSERLDSLEQSHGKLSAETKARDAHHASVAERLDYVEKLLGDSADKHAQDIRATHSKIEMMHSKVSDGRAISEEHVKALLEGEQQVRESHVTSLQERLTKLEQMFGHTTSKHAQELESHKATTARLTSDQKAKDQKHATMAERLEFIEGSLGDSADNHTQELKAAHAKIDKMGARMVVCEKHGNMVQDLQRAHGDMSKEHREKLDTVHASVSERLNYLESIIGDSADKHVKELESVKVASSKLATEAKARDAHHASVAERLDYVEKLMGDSMDKHNREIQVAHSKLEQVQSRVVEVEAKGAHIDTIRKSHATLVSERAVKDAHQSSLQERIDYLEKLMGDSADRHAKEIAAVKTSAEQLHSRLHEERQIREQAHGSLENQLNKEREGRGTHHASFEERVQHLEHALGEHQSSVSELTNHSHSEVQSRMQHHESITEHLANERHAREAHERQVQSHLTSERKAREVHESLVNDQFGNEKGARERHHAHLHELIGREKDARDKHHETHKEMLARERSTAEARHRDLQEVVHKEKGMREQHSSMWQESMQKEKASRTAIEDLLAQEKAERSQHHETIAERVDSLHRTVGVFDSLIRKEIDERSKEYRRIWDAIDNHTHDLSTQVIADDGLYSRAASAADPAPMRSTTPPSTSYAQAWQQKPTPAWAFSDQRLTAVPQPIIQQQVRNPSPMRQAPAYYSAPTTSSTQMAYAPQLSPMSSFAMVPDQSHLDRLSCGHTRYAGENHRSAEIYMN
ncbi:unnamed protein product [Polarella glacialis]|uniref:Uncharacterized protein n=1 Tax=Polarella glacialis TaxID=89957 RepID=A0A813K1M5_POLGL|nr:unnamed protein product [Polarella glacialis]